MRGRFVSEPARSEMHTYPDAAPFVGENINIMISAADSAELIVPLSPSVLILAADLPRFVIEQFMIDSRFRFSPDAKGNVAHDVVHDPGFGY